MIQKNTEAKNERSSLREAFKASKNKLTRIKSKKNEESSPSSREERKQQKVRSDRLRERLVPIWLRLIIIILLFALCLAGGLAVGYGVVGDGNMMDVFKKDTWQHIVDIVKKDA
ncbi:DNA-directed RNA polymerase subunit beta [Pseudalkalibacillus salsuginis]|uniref:DNA-directed RNA polymerase subunit beta n=1 Tax=Pseudalkalibacillus salsuginis TaxID=2910972 RepID=UPI001F307A32|nr:DNA-directed RNA polymerase subunit beta [Pseudalkalibacillus salsuginis]MCF6410964.1 DNA-directed RNA polymerase subunit beta [Pseudalkalibacillus salsuginis]